MIFFIQRKLLPLLPSMCTAAGPRPHLIFAGHKRAVGSKSDVFLPCSQVEVSFCHALKSKRSHLGNIIMTLIEVRKTTTRRRRWWWCRRRSYSYSMILTHLSHARPHDLELFKLQAKHLSSRPFFSPSVFLPLLLWRCSVEWGLGMLGCSCFPCNVGLLLLHLQSSAIFRFPTQGPDTSRSIEHIC